MRKGHRSAHVVLWAMVGVAAASAVGLGLSVRRDADVRNPLPQPALDLLETDGGAS